LFLFYILFFTKINNIYFFCFNLLRMLVVCSFLNWSVKHTPESIPFTRQQTIDLFALSKQWLIDHATLDQIEQKTAATLLKTCLESSLLNVDDLFAYLLSVPLLVSRARLFDAQCASLLQSSFLKSLNKIDVNQTSNTTSTSTITKTILNEDDQLWCLGNV